MSLRRGFVGPARVVLIVAASSLSAACSSDLARFNDPFSNPFRSTSTAAAPAEVMAAPTARVEAAPLQDAIPAGRGPGAIETSPFADAPAVTGSIADRATFGTSAPTTPAVRQMAMGRTSGGETPGRGGWTPIGGSTITARDGETVEALSKRYGVPASAIAMANGFSTGRRLSAGERVVIPTYSQSIGAAAPRAQTQPQTQAQAAAPRQPAATAEARATAPVPPTRMTWQAGPQGSAAPASAQGTGNAPARTAEARPQSPRVARPTSHTVAMGESLASIATRHGVSRQQLAAANGLSLDKPIRIGQVLKLPGAATTNVAAARPAQPAPTAQPARAAETPVRADQARRAVAAAEQSPAGRRADRTATGSIPPTQPEVRAAAPRAAEPQPQAAAAAPAAPAAAEPAREAAAQPQFRWPVRGRVISNFRPGTSDGIKVSVPEGTPVKAAEDGVVAYAGNELRGYGNLILVRHANGFVTAYAHTSDMKVKRGEQVRRGQTIAAAGQTGAVSSPQLHFEIRRGATPVDPMTFLGAARASNE